MGRYPRTARHDQGDRMEAAAFAASSLAGTSRSQRSKGPSAIRWARSTWPSARSCSGDGTGHQLEGARSLAQVPASVRPALRATGFVASAASAASMPRWSCTPVAAANPEGRHRGPSGARWRLGNEHQSREWAGWHSGQTVQRPSFLREDVRFRAPPHSCSCSGVLSTRRAGGPAPATVDLEHGPAREIDLAFLRAWRNAAMPSARHRSLPTRSPPRRVGKCR